MDTGQVLTAFLTAITTGVVVFLAISIAFYTQKRAFIKSIRAYFEAKDEETPSQFAVLIDVIARTFANRIVFSLTQTVKGMNSIDNKLIKKAAVQEAVGQSPILAGLAQVIPKRWVTPEILGMAASILGKKNVPENGSGGPGVQKQLFNL